MSDLDLSKPVRTKSGKPVDIVTAKGRGDYPVIGYIAGGTIPDVWTEYGGFIIEDGPHDLDLENIPQKRSGWVNVYRVSKNLLYTGKVFCTEDFAKEKASHDAIATAYIEWEE